MSPGDKREEIVKLEGMVYKTESDARVAIDKIYAMVEHAPRYQIKHDYNSKTRADMIKILRV